MGLAAAKQNDQIVANDTHIIIHGNSSSPISHPFNGVIDGKLSSDVKIMGLCAAVVGSTASNQPPHTPLGGSFQKPPTNKATIQKGSGSVFINGKPAARNGDTAITCNDPIDLPVGKVVASGLVMIG